jgi:hypothetical protein
MNEEIPDFCPDFDDRPSELSKLLKSYSTREIVEFLSSDRFKQGLIISALEKKDEKHVSAKTLLKGNSEELELLLQDISQQIYKRGSR